jgi:LacI family transcriptional regulator
MYMRMKKILIILDMSREYCRTMIRGITKYASLKGGWNCFGFSEFNTIITKPDSIKRLIDESDGLIAQDTVSKHIFDYANSINKPAVLVRGNIKETYSAYPYPVVIGDNAALVNVAFEHLYSQGFKKMAFCGYKNRPWSEERGLKFGKVAEKYNIPFFTHRVDVGETTEYFEELAELKKWLLLLPKPIGILTASDDVGWFVLEAAKNSNICVPDDVAVLGVENDELLCKLCVPPLSSILRNVEKAGYRAAFMLAQQIRKRKIKNTKIIVEPLYVVKRESTTVTAVSDPDVAKAIDFIYASYRSPIVANDVAEYTHVSPKTLHRKFIKVFGCSVFDKINRVRVEHISRLLAETKLPIYQIARDIGNLNSKHLSRMFKRMKNATPLEYRTKYGMIESER